MVRLKVDVLLASLTPAAVAAKNATNYPIVFHGGFDPVALGLVDSLARPGEMSQASRQLRRRWSASGLKYLKRPFPNSHVAVLWGILKIQALRSNEKKANYRHENWVFNFIQEG
jgi:hypothetical protein